MDAKFGRALIFILLVIAAVGWRFTWIWVPAFLLALAVLLYPKTERQHFS